MFKCRVDDDDELAAATGTTETTRIPTCYKHPTNPNILFWDLPGIGTLNYPDLPTFCEKVAIEIYDTFLIICAGRFKKNDLDLAKKVEEMKKSFFFVRTKFDNDWRSEKRRKGFDETKLMVKLKNNCIENLQSFNFSAEKIFLVSNHKPDKWDFDRLKKAILDQLPTRQKESLTFSLRSRSKSIMTEKVRILKGMCTPKCQYLRYVNVNYIGYQLNYCLWAQPTNWQEEVQLVPEKIFRIYFTSRKLKWVQNWGQVAEAGLFFSWTVFSQWNILAQWCKMYKATLSLTIPISHLEKRKSHHFSGI